VHFIFYVSIASWIHSCKCSFS